MPTVQVRMAPPLHERFIQECEKRELTPSDFIRRLVGAALEQMDTPRQAAPSTFGEQEREHMVIKRISTSQARGFAMDGSELAPSGTRLKKAKDK